MGRAWLWLLALALAANAAVLAAVAWNRSAVVATLELTERELAYDALGLPGEQGQAASTLRLVWRGGEQLDCASLEALGFDCGAQAGVADAEASYVEPAERDAWIVLEYDGDAWNTWRAASVPAEPSIPAEDLESAPPADVAAAVAPLADLGDATESAADALARLDLTESRLFAIDAGPDPDALRARYSDPGRYAIVRGRVGVWPAGASGEIQGSVTAIVPEYIHIDRDLAGVLNALPARPAPWETDDPADLAPRLRVTLKFGARNDPWVDSITRIDQPTGSH
jgi:hypothetical protein